MPFAQPQQKLCAIRRQFSHLSSSSRPKCNFASASKSVSPPLADQTAKMLDVNQNQINSPSADFDLGANLEAYKKRCRALEMENARLLDNTEKIVAESNRRIECHLEEIRCLKEQMDAQRRTNGELLRWAQTAEEESRRAKELSKEWQKFGQCNSQLMKKELHSHQLQMDQLEAKVAKLTDENLELKRLCLYLDEQRQAFWRELSSADQTQFPSTRTNFAPHFAMGRVRCSSDDVKGCCSRSIGTDSAAEERAKMQSAAEDDEGRRGKATKETIQTDYEQEEVLQAICTELSNSMVALSVEGPNGLKESVPANLSVCVQSAPNGNCQQILTAARYSNRPLSNSTVVSGNDSSAECFGHCDGLGLRLPPGDPAAVVVGHDFDEVGSERTSRATADQSLKVHELCTISEEEDRREDIRLRLEKLGETLEDAGNCSMVAEAGSMFTSLMCSDQTPAKQQITEAIGRAMESSIDLVANHRNSTGSSSTSSGAFSGLSRCTDDDGEETEGKGRDRGQDEAEDDLPPRMPLITPGECRFVRHSFREFPFDRRSSSSMAFSVTAATEHQQNLQRQSSTLPRNPLLFTEHQQNGGTSAYTQRTKAMVEKSAEPQKGKSSQQKPVRIRVRPPPTQLVRKTNRTTEEGEKDGAKLTIS